MKRHSIALIIHPYKNALVSEDRLRQALEEFAVRLLDIFGYHQTLRFNLVMPGYFLDFFNPLTLNKLREIFRRDCLEWLLPGFTEPFMGFSPRWLCQENLQTGISAFADLTGIKPSGFVPAFSNWEPSHIEMLRSCGLQYAVLSSAILPPDIRQHCGYWIAEYEGASIPVIPSRIVNYLGAPTGIQNWIEGFFDADPDTVSPSKLCAIEYLVPLFREATVDPFDWLAALAKSLDALLLKYQTVRLNEFPALTPPRGLQYMPPTLALSRDDENLHQHYGNHLHTFEHLGLMQRKLMDVADAVQTQKDTKDGQSLLKSLFAVQDINRYLPLSGSGVTSQQDRLWTYGRLIDIENQLLKQDSTRGGRVQITDFLRNGTKSMVLSNHALKAHIDHKNGGQIFELDVRNKQFNLCAGFHPKAHILPRIIDPTKTYSLFVDHSLTDRCSIDEFLAAPYHKRSDTAVSPFDYKIRKTPEGIRAILRRQGGVAVDGKNYPLLMEKVFGLDGDQPTLSFAYQLSNNSLTSYSFTFATELTFCLPGIDSGQTRLVCGRESYNNLATEKIILENVTKWSLIDLTVGVSIRFTLQKPAQLWCFPAGTPNTPRKDYQGTTLVFSSPVSLAENGQWGLMGKMAIRLVKSKTGLLHEI